MSAAQRRQADTSPVAVCRCPAGWPQHTIRRDDRDNLTTVRRHHPGPCGLPDEEGDR